MQKISSLELVGKNTLEFDLFDENGKILHEKGETITPEITLKLNYINIYKQTDSTQKPPKTKSIKKTFYKPKPLIKETTTKVLLNSTRSIFDKTYNGEILKYNECAEISNTILEEVTLQFEKFYSIEQLRVYDEYTYSHNVNVSSIATLLGIMIGLSDKELEELAIAAFLHDIGKMKVPKEILNKPAKLERPELEIMRRHTLLGYKHIKESLDVPERIARAALDHQEKFNGSGYPNGLKDSEITLYGQITAIADVYDALVSERVYKKGMHPHDALEIILKDADKAFNPELLEKFIKLTQKSETRDEDWD